MSRDHLLKLCSFVHPPATQNGRIIARGAINVNHMKKEVEWLSDGERGLLSEVHSE